MRAFVLFFFGFLSVGCLLSSPVPLISSSSSPKPSFLTWNCHPTTSWRTIIRLAPTTWRAWWSLPIPVWPACAIYLRDTDGRVRIGPTLPLCVMIRGGNGRLHVHLMSLLQDRSRDLILPTNFLHNLTELIYQDWTAYEDSRQVVHKPWL